MNKQIYKPISQSDDPAKISAIIAEQLQIEKQIRLTEEVSQVRSIDPNKFLNSTIVTRQRTFGCD